MIVCRTLNQYTSAAIVALTVVYEKLSTSGRIPLISIMIINNDNN